MHEHSLEGRWAAALEHLESQKSALLARCDETSRRLSGLVDLDTTLSLARTHLAIAATIMEILSEGGAAEELFDRAARETRSGVGILEELKAAGVSEDQKHAITDHPEYRRTAELVQSIILGGGSAFFDSAALDPRREQVVLHAVAGALRRFAAPDDRYERLVKAERLPPVLREIVRFFLPVLSGENDADPPYGIEEGQEQLKVSEGMTMPLSQAILYLEEEVLPRARAELRNNPGSAAVQEYVERVQARIREFRRLRFIPRSTPVLLEKGFYTDAVSTFTADGEMLVSMQLPVTYLSGTNLSRAQELVKLEVVRALVGKGICPELDGEYEYLKSMRSGVRGHSRFASLRLSVPRTFAHLRRQIPGMAVLDDRRQFASLLDLARRSRRRTLVEHLRRRILLPAAGNFPLLDAENRRY